jgi:D-alanine-D-alanine ligase
MHVALLANLKRNAPLWPGIPSDRWDDLDSDATIEAIIEALESGGHRVTFLEADRTLYDEVRRLKPDICFNIAEGHFGDAREAQVPALLEMLRVPYTGSRVLTLALALDKPMTKRILAYHGLPTPPFQVFKQLDQPLDEALRFPLFVKPSCQGTGMGVSGDSVVWTEAQLRHQLQLVFERYQEPALVERFVDGREVTVGLVGNLGANGSLHVFPPLEVDMAAYPPEENGIYTGRLKVELAHQFHYHCPAPLAEAQVAQLKALTVETFRVLGCLDVARVDFRLDGSDGDTPYILEINPLPGLNPDYSDLCIEAAAAGWTYAALINRILDQAITRYSLGD